MSVSESSESQSRASESPTSCIECDNIPCIVANFRSDIMESSDFSLHVQTLSRSKKDTHEETLDGTNDLMQFYCF